MVYKKYLKNINLLKINIYVINNIIKVFGDNIFG